MYVVDYILYCSMGVDVATRPRAELQIPESHIEIVLIVQRLCPPNPFLALSPDRRCETLPLKIEE